MPKGLNLKICVKNWTSEWNKNNNTSFHMFLDLCFAFSLLL